MNEAYISRKIKQELVALGAEVWKVSDRFHASRPDLLFVHSGVTTFIEVKVHPNTTTDLQVLTLTQLAARGAPAYLITYHKQTKVFDVVTIAAGTQTTFKNVKDLSVWLVEHNCLNINARPLN